MKDSVRVWTDVVVLPTYLPASPEVNPMFLEKRVYQGSSGRVYPLPFTDRVAETPVDRPWKVVWIENTYLRVMILPELGGRIHAIEDRVTGYDLVYRQPVIKPALVGLAGPWISGGIEFNWPQHHRPATFLPVEVAIDKDADGSHTVWLGDHDPMARMRGVHGVCLHPGRALVELKVRVLNRTSAVQTFLWWANVATRVHEDYQSVFPPDMRWVADHARRATSRFPLAEGTYYGVDYGRRGRTGLTAEERPTRYVPNRRDCRPNDLSWYANIPTPCSYMCLGSEADFFGGYDHRAGAGLIHIANHHISPGKKQWTWGNHAFGHAWDRNLTVPTPDGEFPPYIELMAGVYTDNQPDFTHLQPGEVKTWSQYWYPVQRIGPPHHANVHGAVRLDIDRRRARIGVNVTTDIPGARIRLLTGTTSRRWKTDLTPGKPWWGEVQLGSALASDSTPTVEIVDREGTVRLRYARPKPLDEPEPSSASEPPAPRDVGSTDQLYLIGVHLEQYRHATRCPTLYWREALRRDPGDARCSLAMGRWHLRRGEFVDAESCFRRSIARLTERNGNPADGEAFYQLGVCLRYQGRDDEAYRALYKATWSQAWAGAGYHALAEIDGCRADWGVAAEHLSHALRAQGDHPRAQALLGWVLRKLGRSRQADSIWRDRLKVDPLDAWTRHLMGQELKVDLQVRLDLAHDAVRCGLLDSALAALRAGTMASRDLPDQNLGAAPLVHYTRAWILDRTGDRQGSRASLREAAAASPDYCFPARLEEIAVFEFALRTQPEDARAPYYLGNLLYDRRRHTEAIRLWERSARLDPTFSVVWRNLGIAYFNVSGSPAKARRAFDRAVQCRPDDARLWYERDQLGKRIGMEPLRRRKVLASRRDLVGLRDDLTLEYATLLNQTGRHAEALECLESRRFQPWEGGEGLVLGQYVRTRLAIGREALARGDANRAEVEFRRALQPPETLGEARHPLANDSDVRFWLGCALARQGHRREARVQWQRAASFRGDFQDMKVQAFSELTYYSAMACARLGQRSRAARLLGALLTHAKSLRNRQATIDYFATSLPNMLLFDDDLLARQQVSALFLEAQAHLGLGRQRRARRILQEVLRRDPNHSLAADLLLDLSNPSL